MSEATMPTGEFFPPTTSAAAPNESEPVANQPTTEQPFEMGSWKNLPRWQCRRCAWDTVESEEAFWAHFYEQHAPPPPPLAPRPATPLVDRYGNPIGG